MPHVRTIQQRFTNGELDPKMIGRTDIEQYYGALESAKNVFPIPQGGARRRPGLEHRDKNLRILTMEASPTITTPNGGTGANANDDDTGTSLTTTTNISTVNPYVVCSYDLGSSKRIGVVRVKGLVISSGTGGEFYVQVSDDAVTWTSVGSEITLTTTAQYVSRRVQDSHRYVRLARIGSTDLGATTVTLTEFNVWTEGDVSSSRLVPFSFSVTQTYMLVFTDKNIAVYKDGLLQVDVEATDFLDDNIGEINWTQSADTAILVHEDIAPKTLVRNDDDDWTLADITFEFVPKYDFVPSTSNPAATLTPSAKEGSVTLTASAGVFSSGDVDQYVSGNGGRARIVEYTSTTVVKAVIEIPFFDTNAIASGSWDLLSGYEDVWSSTRGYPKSVAFYEGRLWFGGSKTRVHTLWGSRVSLFYDFNLGTGLADDAIDATLDTDELNVIVNLYSGRTMQIFTSGAEFIITQTLGEPITPTNINIKRQTSIGSASGLRPVELEGGVIYIQREGKSIQEFIYNDTQQAYSNNYVSLLSSHLVTSPVDFAARKSTSTEEGAYLLLVNGDGNLTTVTILRSQNITSFAEQITDGTFLNCGVDGTEMFFVIERTIDGTTERYLEKFNYDHFMDASTRVTTGLPTDTFTGLDHLEGETCRIKADESVMANQAVASGSVTIERDAEDSFEIGLDFSPTIKDLPVEALQQILGTSLGLKKSVSEVILRLYETEGIVINGKPLSFRRFGEAGAGSPLDAPPPQFTGVKVKRGFKGWDLNAQVTITQDNPVRMTILGLSKRVNISGY